MPTSHAKREGRSHRRNVVQRRRNFPSVSLVLLYSCFSLAQDVQQNRNVCVCLWEPPESRSGAKREPQLLRIHRLLNSSPLCWWEYVPIRPQRAAGTDSPTTLRSPSADGCCPFSSGFYGSESPAWPDEDVSLKVLKNELFASNAVYFFYTSFCWFF